VWPETAYPYRVAHGAPVALDGARALVQPGVRGPIIAGVQTRGATPGVFYNSVVVATGDGALSGRTTSGTSSGSARPCRSPIASRGSGASSRGPRPPPRGPRRAARGSRVRAAALVVLRGHAARGGARGDDGRAQPARERHQRRVVLGYGRTGAAPAGAVLRAVELRRDMVRAVNSGPRRGWMRRDAYGGGRRPSRRRRCPPCLPCSMGPRPSTRGSGTRRGRSSPSSSRTSRVACGTPATDRRYGLKSSVASARGSSRSRPPSGSPWWTPSSTRASSSARSQASSSTCPASSSASWSCPSAPGRCPWPSSSP